MARIGRWPVAATLGLVLLAGAALARDLTIRLRPEEGVVPLLLPPPPPADVSLILDDDSSDGAVGVGDPAEQFLWFNRFASPAGAFDLEEVWVFFDDDMTVGDAIQLAVYHDTDGDPTNGATLLADFDETIQVADGLTFSVYTLAPPVPFPGGGDVLIGVVPRFITSGVTPSNEPATIDLTTDQARSWIAFWSGDPPDPPLLPPDLTIQPIGDFDVAGNWMIRGFGTFQGPVDPLLEIPVLAPLGAGLLAAATGLAGATVLGRRRRRESRPIDGTEDDSESGSAR